MNENYLRKYLDIKVFDDKTQVQFWKDDVLATTSEFYIGINQISENLVSEAIMNDWLGGIVYNLEKISLLDRIPTFFYLTTEKYGSVFEKFLKRKGTYSQFYLEPHQYGLGIHVIIKKINRININTHFGKSITNEDLRDKVIIKDNKEDSKSYERYTKAISQFKI
ncbi:hypothetical protein SDC9_07913 [bioreactor metagenome]|uniref:Uncharacterized protein n=1 Tax=bioreactor metagenome TaxID=1076179 RepID=A0A644T622_9ZZZZ|nr:hypothetical protein [Candidatus Elulimicrobiales bacterium]